MNPETVCKQIAFPPKIASFCGTCSVSDRPCRPSFRAGYTQLLCHTALVLC